MKPSARQALLLEHLGAFAWERGKLGVHPYAICSRLWPEEVLRSVSLKFLSDIDLGGKETTAAVSEFMAGCQSDIVREADDFDVHIVGSHEPEPAP